METLILFKQKPSVLTSVSVQWCSLYNYKCTCFCAVFWWELYELECITSCVCRARSCGITTNRKYVQLHVWFVPTLNNNLISINLTGKISLSFEFLCWIWHYEITVIWRGNQRVVDPEKSHLTWTLRRSLSAELDTPWSVKGPNFMNNKRHLLKGAPHVLCILGRTSDWPLGFPNYASPRLRPLSEPLKRKPGFVSLLVVWDLPSPIRTAQFRDLIYIKWT